MIGLVLIATGGPRYTQFLLPLAQSITRFMPPNEMVLFTDERSANDKVTMPSAYSQDPSCIPLAMTFHRVYQPNLGWPRATLMRYHAITQEEKLLHQYSHVFYMDIDMLVESPINAHEICSDGITAVIHPGYPQSFERNPASAAYLPGDNHTYYQGCFIGGETAAFLYMAKEIADGIDRDDEKKLVALWHDESHLNHYLAYHPPTIRLSPAFAFPAPHYLKTPDRWLAGRSLEGFVPKIRHIEKTEQGKWKNK